MNSPKIAINSIAKKYASLYTQNPYLAVATTVHRTHRNIKMSVPKDSYLYDIYTDKNPCMVIKKSVQSGISEYLLVRSFVRAIDGKIVYYVLPTYVLKNQYVQERVDKSILHTPYYLSFLKGSELAESLSIKQFPNGSIIYVGSTVEPVMTPVDDVIVDELDLCDQDKIIMTSERQSASEDKTTVKVGNPTFSGFGIDVEFENSDKKQWFIKHDCGEWTHPDFFKHVIREIDEGQFVLRDKDFKRDSIRDVFPICDKCNKPYNRFDPGEWVSEQRHENSGRHVSKMFSTVVTMRDIIERFEAGLVNDYAMQRFHNGDLGEAYTAAGAKINRNMLNDCRGDYIMKQSSNGPCVTGIDVGSTNHLITAEITQDNKLKIVYIGTIMDEQDVFIHLKAFNSRIFVIDALPETRMSKRLCVTTKRGFMCYYTTGKKDLALIPRQFAININRTMALDAIKENLITQNVLLPAGSENIPDFYDHMEACTRVYDEKNERYDWVKGIKPDHYFHAFAYMLLAKRLLIMARR